MSNLNDSNSSKKVDDSTSKDVSSTNFGSSNAVNGDDTGPQAILNGDENQNVKAATKTKLIPASDLEKMVSDSMRDISSDEEGGDDDADLLRELEAITSDDPNHPSTADEAVLPQQQTILATTSTDTISIINSRIEMYKQAESTARSCNASAKARRFQRGLSTLNDILKQSLAGEIIKVEDIPPEVSVKIANTPADVESEGTESN